MDFETTSLPILQSKELEQNFLGSILINPNCMDTIDLEPDELYFEVYSNLYKILRNMYLCKEPIDITTVSDEIQKKKDGNSIPDIVEIVQIINNTANSFHAETYAQRIRDYARRRNLLTSANRLAKAAFDLESPIDSSVGEIVENIVSGTQGGGGATHWSSAVEELYLDVTEKIEKYQKSGGNIEIDGIPTGFQDIDAITGGLHNGEVTYIAGPPAVGKSVLAHKIAFNVARIPNTYAVVYSLEMNRIQVARRLISAWTGIKVASLRIGNLSDDQIAKLPMAVNDSFDVDLHICEKTGVTLNYMRADIARIKAKNRGKKLGIVLVDYALLVDAPGKDETERSAYISSTLKNMSGKDEIDAPFLAIESVVKSGMDGGTPSKASMRGSGQQIHDADVVLYVLDHIPGEGEDKRLDVATCIFAKVREPLSDKRIFNMIRGNGVPDFYPMSAYINPGDSEEVF